MVHKIILGLLVLLSMGKISAQGIKFEKGSLHALLQKAKAENKLLFIDAMADWCGPCKLMDKNIFSKTEVGAFYNKHFINAKFDMQKDAVGMEIAKKYNVYSYPTFLFLNGDGQLIMENKGYMDESSFMNLGKHAANATTVLAEVKEKFLKGDHSPQVLASVIRTYIKTDAELAKKASEIYFENKKDADISPEEVGFILSFLRSVDDKLYPYFKKYRSEIEKHVHPDMVKNFDTQLQIIGFWEQSLDAKNKTIDDAHFLALSVPILGEEMAQSYLNQLKLNYYESSGEFALYEKIAEEVLMSSTPIPTNDGLKIAWNIAEQSSNKSVLQAAAMWVEKQLMNYETHYNAFILSKLYAKLGKKSEAIMFAESAVKLAEQANQDSAGMKLHLKSLKK